LQTNPDAIAVRRVNDETHHPVALKTSCIRKHISRRDYQPHDYSAMGFGRLELL
jgi:hypothetical protein